MTPILPRNGVSELAGAVHSGLWRITEVIDYLPQGLANSLTDQTITIDDTAPDGTPQDPADTIAVAAAALRIAATALRLAADSIGTAQVAISGQSYDDVQGRT